MKINFVLIFTFISINLFSQVSVFDFASVNDLVVSKDLIKENHTKISYSRVFDLDQRVDTIINYNGVDVSFFKLGQKIVKWQDKSTFFEFDFSESTNQMDTSVVKIDEHGNIISEENLNLKTKMVIMYDSLKRVVELNITKENETETALIVKYEKDSNFPIQVNSNSGVFEIDIKRYKSKSGYKYVIENSLPKKQVINLRKEFGNKISEEKLLKKIGFIKRTAYNDIVFLENGNFKELVYFEDIYEKGKINLLSERIYNKNLNLVSKTFYNQSAINDTIIILYNESGKLKSISKSNGELLTNQFDSYGNVVKEYKVDGLIERSYMNNRKIKEIEVNNGKNMFIKIYKY